MGGYMGGGTIAILNRNGKQISSRRLATGMVGGRIYVRGPIAADGIGLQPKRADIENYLNSLFDEGAIDEVALAKAGTSDCSLEAISEILPEKIVKSIKRFYIGKYSTRIIAKHRHLGPSDILFLKPALDAYASEFDCAEKLEGALRDRFTVITTADSFGGQGVVEE